ncbi:MAG: hypothetical protein LBM69_02300 [Lachnospiraceae bacterium]|nr:hypothetical protein [Lachnospiraceae bacterium]
MIDTDGEARFILQNDPVEIKTDNEIEEWILPEGFNPHHPEDKLFSELELGC